MVWIRAGFIVGCVAGAAWGLAFRSIPFDVLVFGVFTLTGGVAGLVGGASIWLAAGWIRPWPSRFAAAAIGGAAIGYIVAEWLADGFYSLPMLTGVIAGVATVAMVKNSLEPPR